MTTETAIPVRIRSVEIVVAPAIPSPVRIRTKRRRSARALAGFLTALFAMNAALSLLLEAGPAHLRDPEYGLRLKSLRERRRQFPDRRLTVILGSSRTAMGIRPDVYEATLDEPLDAPLLFNMSMSGAGPILQLMMLERLLADGVRPDALLLEYWPALLRGDGPYREDRRVNAERLRASDDPIIAEYFTDPEATRTRMRADRLLPAWYHRRALLEQHWPSALPWSERTDGAWSTLDGWGWLPGRKTYTAAQVERGWPHVAGFYGPLFHGYGIAALADRALRACFARCRELGIEMSWIALPESARFRTLMTPDAIRFSDEHRTRLQSEWNVPFVDGRAWADDAALPDGFHLTQDGATAFTRKLAVRLAPQR